MRTWAYAAALGFVLIIYAFFWDTLKYGNIYIGKKLSEIEKKVEDLEKKTRTIR